MQRPKLNEVPLDQARAFVRGRCSITMSPGQWDVMLDETYRQGWLLIEIKNERPVRAYQKEGS